MRITKNPEKKHMEFTNLLTAKNRDELREWFADNHDKEKECWVIVKRGRRLMTARLVHRCH